MKVVFVFFNHPPTPFNTSVAALSGVVRDAGHERAAVSIPLETSPCVAAERVDSEGADVVLVSAMTRDWPAARALLEALPRGPLRVIGGYHASLVPHEVARCDAVDAICIGDGERPLRAILDGAPTRTIPGLWVRGPRGFDGPPPPPDPEPDIGALPAWDYDVFGGVDAILEYGVNTFGPLVDRFLPTRASRGCPFRCAYCSAPVWGEVTGFAARGSRNVRPVDQLVGELEALRDAGGPAGFEFWDEHFPVDIGWLDAFSEIYPRQVGLPFKVEMHPSAATRARLERLAKAGCRLFHCGVESGDAALRRGTLGRRTSARVLARVFDDARELGLETSASVMTGLPTETYAQAHETVELLRRLAPDSFMWSTFMTLPRTALGEAWADHEGPVSVMTEGERAAIHAELTALQDALVLRAADRGARPRPVAIPGAVRSPAVKRVTRRESDQEAQEALASEVAAALGFDAPDAPRSGLFFVVSARWAGPELLVEIESAATRPQVISIAMIDGAAAYVQSAELRFGHRGADAPTEVLAELERLARSLDAATFAGVYRA